MSAAPGAKIGSGRAAEVFEHGPGRIIKLLREPGPAEWLEREAAAQSAARAAGVAAPEVFGIEELEGRRGIVMERVEGLDGLTAIEEDWTQTPDLGRIESYLETKTVWHPVGV